MNVKLTPRAVARLRAVREYVAGDDPAAADRLVARLLDRTAMLADFPEMGRRVPELPRGNLREVIEGRYRIVYRVRGEDVEVLTVFAGEYASEIERLPADPSRASDLLAAYVAASPPA